MRALFFYPEIKNSFRLVSPPLGIMSICSFLNEHGHEAKICTAVSSKSKIKKHINDFSPNVIGVSVISFKYLSNALLISKTAKKLGYVVVWGGPMASVIPELIIESGLVDAVSLKEGEMTWLDIANAMDQSAPWTNIKGLALKQGNDIIYTGERENMDLSVLPKIDWTLIDPEKYTEANFGCNKSIHIYWSKGCVGNCAFCYNRAFHCSKRRQRPINILLEEMKYLIDNHGIDGFEFTDDLLFQNKEQMYELCNSLIDNNINISWTAYERIGIVNDQEDYDLLYKSGCRCLMFGIESGSKTIQKEMHKTISEQRIIQNINACKKAGIIPLVAFMAAFPDETEDDLKQTIELINKLEGSIVCMSLLTPEPGTEIFNMLVESGKMKPLKTLKQYSNVRWGDKLYVNTSKIKNNELHAISNYYDIKRMFFKNDITPEKHFLDTVENVAKIIFRKSPIESAKLSVYIFNNLCRYSTLFFHPIIRKKYNLYFRRRETNNASNAD